MRILVLGGGGREHALSWKLAQSPGVDVFASPGNPGIAQIATCLPTASSYLALADEIRADLTVVGPEAPLVAGVVDEFRAAGRKIVGPNRAAAQLEGSKIFAKHFFKQIGIPTADYVSVENPSELHRAVHRMGLPVVLKADGLAAGKGVVIVHNPDDFHAALATLTGPLVVEEFLRGEEVSFIALCDGRNVVPLAPTQDHKAVFDGDTGPNTGGMGSYCDPAILTDAQTHYILDHVIQPTLEATGFTGFLYAGLMMTEAGPKVLEFNVRLGDPETQPLMLRMASDFVPALMAAATGGLAGGKLEWHADPTVCVVLASGGYPGPFETGKPIHGIAEAEATGATVFHAGTRLDASAVTSGGLITSGGRVLSVTASGDTLGAAIDHAYRGVHQIAFDGIHYRTDIGRKGLARSTPPAASA